MTKPRKPKLHPMHGDSPLWDKVDARAREEVALRRPSQGDIDRANAVADVLAREFPGAFCALTFETPFQLLVATILSAQCTDVRVNMVTPALFAKFKSPLDFAEAPPGELEEAIRTTGFFNSKAKSIRAASQTLLDDFGGEMPETIEELLTLRGAARKTSNVVRMHAFGYPGISVDTHFMRITQRLKLTKNTDPEKIEFDLAAMLPPEKWTKFADSVILHGRKTCTARAPKCGECPIQTLCPSAFKVKIAPPKKAV